MMDRKLHPLKKKRIKLDFDQRKREEFYHRMIALRDTGMPIEEILEQCLRVASEDGLKPKNNEAILLRDVLDKKLNGASLAEALSDWLPAEDVMIFEAVQDSRRFSDSLKDYLTISEKKRKIRRTIVVGMIMPVIMIAMTIGMAYSFGSSVVPMVADLLPMEEWQGAALFLKGFSFFAETLFVPIILGIIITIVTVFALLPRWAGRGRSVADNFPIFSTYKVYTGISFLVALSSLTTSGVNIEDALVKLQKRATPYVKHRIDLIYSNKMNGDNLGEAMHRTGTNWPDKTMNLSIKIFAETNDISAQLSRLAMHFIDESQQAVTRNMAIVSLAGLFLVFGVLMGFVGGIFALNSQVTAAQGAGF